MHLHKIKVTNVKRSIALSKKRMEKKYKDSPKVAVQQLSTSLPSNPAFRSSFRI